MSETPDQRLARLLAEAEQARRDVEAMTTTAADSTALAPIAGTSAAAVPAEVSKRQMAEVRAAAIKKKAEIEAIQEQMRAELEARMREMNAVLAPLQQQVKQMEEGIWTINLYLGRDEEIVRLTEGAPAPAETPLTLRQQVLSMDEETAAHADEGGIDARNLDVFDEWISRPENLARVLPEPKGVVVLVPRRRGRDYADPWANVRLNEENRWSYFLIRNGENLFRMRTDFVVGKRLIPGTKEFTDLFTTTRYNHETRQQERVELVPGTREWNQAAEAQGAKQRHYMRMALILQGLVDRTTVFHPLPEHGINLLDDRTYTHGLANLVLDAENVLTDGRPDFYTWLAEKTSQMRVGMRVMGAFNTKTFKDTGDEGSDGDHYYPNDRITPRPRDRWSVDRPADATLYRLEGKKTERGVTGYIFKFERSKKWIDHEYRTPKTKATCLVAPGDRFILPFDLVTVEECRYYLEARSQRHAYEEMFPLLKACIAAKEAEAAAEAPFRDLLARTLVDADPDLAEACASDPDLRAAHTVLDPLVDWWKLANKYHRALTGEPEHEAQAIRDIITEHRARKNGTATQSGDESAEQAAVARLLAHDPTIAVVGRTRDGGYLAFAPMPRTYPAGKVGYPATNITQPPLLSEEEAKQPFPRSSLPRESNQIPAAVADNVWAREYTTTKTGRTIKSRDWVQPGTRLDRTRILHTTDAWSNWDIHADPNEHLTDPEIDAALAQIIPEVEEQARAGWPARYRGGDRGEPVEPLLLGACLRTDPGDYDEQPRFEVHLIAADEPAGLGEKPSALAGNTVKAVYGKVLVPFTKTRGGVTLKRDSYTGKFSFSLHDGGGYGTATPGRPWHYYWSGRAKDAIALVEFPENQQVAQERHTRIAAHNRAVATLREKATAPLWHAKRAGDAAKEAAAYARFLDDYADPDLWEGHRKTLRESLEIELHPMGRGVPGALRTALYRFADEGWSLEGHTIATAIEKAGLSLDGIDEALLDLPLWEKQ